MNWCASSLATVLLSAAASAAPIVQAEPSIVGAFGMVAAGGPERQRLAQTLQARTAGSLTRIDVAAACADGTLTVEVVSLKGDLPGDRVLARGTLDAAAAPRDASPPPFARVALNRPVKLSRGDRFAIVMRNDAGSCGIAVPTDVDTYENGKAYFDEPAKPGWKALRFLSRFVDYAVMAIIE